MNRNGLTLVETVVAMAIFALIAAMLFTILNYSIKANKVTRLRNREVNIQVGDIAAYDPNGTSEMSVVNKIIKNGTSNEYELKFDFNGTTFSNKTYAYMAKKNNEAENQVYQLKFLQADVVSLIPAQNVEIVTDTTTDPPTTEYFDYYWINLENVTDADIKVKSFDSTVPLCNKFRAEYQASGVNIPAQTKSGFGVRLPHGTTNVTITIDGTKNYVLSSFSSTAPFVNVSYNGTDLTSK